ncbi:uncharacterized protein RB166_016312 [Leptodactylus fuscus]|uniref:uncharacterized protein LOC142216170 n=1 Tax=Leptodactylus fuscus TaxID=238119 RepID=UPI003F4E5E6A
MAPWWPGTSLFSIKAPRKLVFLFTLSLSVTYLFYSLLSCYSSLQFPLQDAGIYLQAESGLSPVDVIRTASLRPDTSNPDLSIPGTGPPERRRSNKSRPVTSTSSLDSSVPSSTGSSIHRNGNIALKADLEYKKSSGDIRAPLAVVEFSNPEPSQPASSASFSRIRTLTTVLQPGWPSVRSSTPVHPATKRPGSLEVQKHKSPADSTVSRKSPRDLSQVPSTAVSVSTLDSTPILSSQEFSTLKKAPIEEAQRVSTLVRDPIVAAQSFRTVDSLDSLQPFRTLDRAPVVAAEGFSTVDTSQGFSTLDRAPIETGPGFSTLHRAAILTAQGFSTVDSSQGFSTLERSPVLAPSQDFSTLDRSPVLATSQDFSTLDNSPVLAPSQGFSTLDSSTIISSAPGFNSIHTAQKIQLSHDQDNDISLQGSAKVTKESYQQSFSLSTDSTALPSVSPRLDDFSAADTAPIHKSNHPTYTTRDTQPRISSREKITRPSDYTGDDMHTPFKGISTWDSTPLAATEMIPESHTGYLERETQESSTTEDELSRRLSVNSTIEYGDKKLPQAIIIGVKKGGTRALLEALRAHPDVRAVGVEPHFFDRNYEKGLEWYRDLMPRTVDGQITMEKTPSYFVTNEAPQRIHSMAKDTKLIVVVRNPVTRAISDYTQTLSKKPEIPTFEVLAFKNRTLGLIDASWSALRIGIYALHLESWMQYFPLSQILFVSGERLISNPAEELAKVQDFLGLQRIITDKHFYFNKTKGFPCLKKPEDTGAPRCLGKSKGRTHPKIDPDVIQRLRKFYKPFNAMFYQMTGQDFQWEKEELES